MKPDYKIKRSKDAFTLIEVMVVIIILVIIAAFAIPDYTESVNRTRVRDAISQLSVLNAANAVYNAQANEFFPGASLTLSQINAGLNINLIANGLTYSYTQSSATAYTATAAYGSNFTVRVDEGVIASDNPCCSAGDCYSIIDDCP